MAQVYNFGYTGNVQSVVLQPGTYKLECWGASSGGSTNGGAKYAGKGGYSTGVLTVVEKNKVLYVYVGEQGTCSSKSVVAPLNHVVFNGGGNVTTGNTSASGGGATDIRYIGGNWNDATSLYSRIIVAGAGGGPYGGTSTSNYYGGHGGGESGIKGSGYSTTRTGSGGTQSAGGAAGMVSSSKIASAGTFGKGGDGISDASYGAGGGGGWYGGGGGYCDAGGGGSSYILTSTSHRPSGYNPPAMYNMTSASTIAGNASMPSTSGGTETGHTGTGYARITLIEEYSFYNIKIKENNISLSGTLTTGNVSEVKIYLNEVCIHTTNSADGSFSYSIDKNSFNGGINYIRAEIKYNLNGNTVTETANGKYIVYGGHITGDLDLSTLYSYMQAMYRHIESIKDNMYNILSSNGLVSSPINKITDMINLIDNLSGDNTELSNRITELEGIVANYNSVKNDIVTLLNNKGLTTSNDTPFNEIIDTIDTGLVTPTGTATAGNVLSGQTFINSTGQVVTGTMVNNGSKTITPGTSSQTLGAGYYSGITINGDVDLNSSYIISGKNIFGVNGTATVESLGGRIYKSGSVSVSANTPFNNYTINLNTSFTPSIVFVEIHGDVQYRGNIQDTTTRRITNLVLCSFANTAPSTYGLEERVTLQLSIKDNTITLVTASTNVNIMSGASVRWYAIS